MQANLQIDLVRQLLIHTLQAILENELASTSAKYEQSQQQLEAVERNRSHLEASWLHNRRLNRAACVIQRRYRVWRSRNHVAKFGRDAEVVLLSGCDGVVKV